MVRSGGIALWSWKGGKGGESKGEGGRRKGKEEAVEATLIKSNNPQMAGGEQGKPVEILEVRRLTSRPSVAHKPAVSSFLLSLSS